MKFLSGLLDTFPHLIEGALQEIAEAVQNKAKTSTMFNGGPNSLLRQNIKIRNISNIEKSVVADTRYAHWVEDGNNENGPYIYPINSAALHFFINGKEIFARKVKSHGPIPFMKTAEEQVKPMVNSIVSKHVAKWIAG